MNKIFRKLKTCGTSIEAFPGDYKAFGIDIACLKFRRRLGIVNVKTYIDEVSSWMEHELHQFILTFVDMGGTKPEAHADLKGISPVWVCWLQGEKSMPSICKASFKQLKTQLEGKQHIVFLTLENLQEYISLPAFIWDLYNSGKMTPVALTDIIRHALLAVYGGLWIDSVIYITGHPFRYMLDNDFYSVRFYDKTSPLLDASRGRWINGFIYVRNGKILPLFCYNALLYLWNKHKRIIDYLQLDYIIWAGYQNIPEIKQLVDSVPINNRDIRLLNSKFNDEYNEYEFKQICEKQHVHLINRHLNYNLKTSQGKMTFYDRIVG